MSLKSIAGNISFDKKELKEGESSRKKLENHILARGSEMGECTTCGSFTYLNDEMECLCCQEKKMKNGPLLKKKKDLEKESRKLENLQLKMREILGKL